MKKYGLSGQDKTVKLNKLHVSGNVCGEYIEYTIAQHYRNTSAEDVHCTYSFPVPETATLTGFSLSLGGKSLSASVESRDEVLTIIKNAKDEDLNPISLESDDEEDFQITVGDVMPNETVVIRITYMDQLIYHDNLLKVIIPSVIDPTYVLSETEEELAGPGTESPEFYLSLLIESFGEVSLKSSTHKINVERQDETLRKVTIEQGQTLDRDFVLELTERRPRQADGIAYSWYDQEAEEEKAILMMRFFPILPDDGMSGEKNYTFIMDMSQTMEGKKAEEARSALLLALRALDDGDRFNIISFSERSEVFSPRGKVAYNKETLEAATEWIEGLTVHNGADIRSALNLAIEEAREDDPEIPNYVFLFSDEHVENEDEILEFVQNHIGSVRLFTIGMDSEVNSYFLSRLAEAGGGKAEFVEEGQRLDDIILRHFHRIHNPQMDVTSIDWGEMEIERTYPGTISYLYDREPFTIFAAVNGSIAGKVVLRGKVVGRSEELEHKLTADLDKLEIEENSQLIEKVWARKMIESLEEREHKMRGHERDQVRERILELSKEFNMLSSETAFILIEAVEDPVSGFVMNRIVPLEMSLETMKLLSESFFLDDTRYSADLNLRETMAAKGLSRQEARRVIQFERENLLRILAKNQQADGSFKDMGEDEPQAILETTLKGLLAFTAGNEPATIYLTSINKAFTFVMKTIGEDERLLTERNLMLLSIAYELAHAKRLIKERTIVSLDGLFDRIEEGEFPSSLKEVESVVAATSPLQMKFIMAAALNISASQIGDLEEIFEKDIKSHISRISEVALAKAL
ncbi:hypothetical protein ABB02_01133 [Clostridiaceae bacterium JG1575]|nr:hypothetical protein ABB02_01133 [Clostridiaceae bacterium JG1575]